MENLCKCSNCESVLIDENPQVDAIKYELKGGELSMIQVNLGNDGDSVDDEIIWACPICETDGFLADIED